MNKVQSRILAAVLSWMASLPSHAQICNPAIRESAPASRFTINANGTVLDNKTGLTWKQCVEGQSGAGCATGIPSAFTWGDALTQAAGSTFAGYADWRLPNLKELRSLAEVKCYGPAINLTVFPNTSSDYFWSSSPVVGSNPHARGIYFLYGYDEWYAKGGAYYIRLVRGGQ